MTANYDRTLVTASPAKTFEAWSLLPTELKLEVLLYSVPYKVDVNRSAHDMFFKKGIMSTILGTQNRELTKLSLNLYHTTNRFSIKISCWPFTNTISRPPPAYAPMIRTLLIDTYGLKIHELLSLTLNSNTSSAWQLLLQPLAGPSEALHGHAAWQRQFSGLCSLTMELWFHKQGKVYDGCSKCGWPPNELEALREWLNDIQIDLKADKVKVTVRNRCHSLLCECERSIEELLEKMASKKR